MNKPLIVTIVIVAALLCGGVAWYLLRDSEPDGEVRIFVDGKEVSPKDVKEIKLPGGKSLSGGMFDPRAQMKEMLDGYFNLPEGPKRSAYLDQMIDMQEQARKHVNIAPDAEGKPQVRFAGGQPATQPSDGEKKTQVIVRSGANAADSIPPELGAKMAEFVSAINKRRAERGLPAQQGMMFIRMKQD